MEHHLKKVKFFPTVDLINKPGQDRAMNNAVQIADRLSRPDLIILRELGYLPLRALGRAPLSHLLSRLYKKTRPHIHKG